MNQSVFGSFLLTNFYFLFFIIFYYFLFILSSTEDVIGGEISYVGVPTIIPTIHLVLMKSDEGKGGAKGEVSLHRRGDASY